MDLGKQTEEPKKIHHILWSHAIDAAVSRSRSWLEENIPEFLKIEFNYGLRIIGNNFYVTANPLEQMPFYFRNKIRKYESHLSELVQYLRLQPFTYKPDVTLESKVA